MTLEKFQFLNQRENNVKIVDVLSMLTETKGNK